MSDKEPCPTCDRDLWYPEWYEDHQNLARVARHMGEQGDSVENVAYMLEKPWKFEDEWRRANIRGGVA